MNIYLKSESCRTVEGYLRGCIYDLDRRSFDLVPNTFISFLDFMNGRSYDDLTLFEIDEDQIKYEYLEYAIEKEFLLEISNSVFNNFTPLQIDYESPVSINTVVVYLDDFPLINLELKINEILEVGGDTIIFIVDYCYQLALIQKIRSFTLDNETVELIFLIKFQSDKLCEIILNALNSPLNISCVGFFDAPESKIFSEDKYDDLKGFYIDQKFDRTIGFVDFDNFKVSNEIFRESNDYNIYYNRRIFMDKEGNMASDLWFNNRIESNQDLSNFENVFSKAVKCKMGVCSICEFRNMCMDPREPVLDNDGSFYYKEECNYNPFIGKWKGELGYQNLEEIGIETEKASFRVVDENKLNEVVGLLYM